MPLHVSSTCARHQEVKTELHSLWYYHTYRCDDTRGCVMEFWPPDDEHVCSKHVEAWNKLIVKQNFCASSWLITEINVLSCLQKCVMYMNSNSETMLNQIVLCHSSGGNEDSHKVTEISLTIQFYVCSLYLEASSCKLGTLQPSQHVSKVWLCKEVRNVEEMKGMK